MNACMNCKSELAADHRFCPRCGTPASKDLEQYMLARSAMEGRMEGGPVQPAIASLEKAYKMGLRDAHVLTVWATSRWQPSTLKKRSRSSQISPRRTTTWP